ncbi:hypothetical protein Clacol_009514 [Clathrus columnatus]|uniref:Uncharacterized protein n=1 Tax=Clathrus columnatus TaxID=1419009 RepID=A0AAV5ARC4_9AGAM|nr:hypothetical protein Clacol_009514 [Clathrus columnatus]
MSRTGTKTHERDLSSDISFPTYTTTNANANITSRHDQTVAFPSEYLPPRRRPRGNTFGLPAPDTGKMLVPTDKSRTEGVMRPQQQEVNEQYDEDGDEDEHGRYSYHNHNDMNPRNQDHTFGVNMPHLTGRRSRTDSYASTTSAYSYAYDADASRLYGADGTRIGEPGYNNVSMNRERSSVYATGSMSVQDSIYGENNDKDRTSMLTSTTMDFYNHWSSSETGGPRGSITSFLTFGQSATPRRISVVGGGSGHDVGGSTAIKPSINGGADGADSAASRHGVSPSPALSLSVLDSHPHTTTRTLRHSGYKVSPRPSVESLRSSHSVVGSSGLNPGSASHLSSSGIPPTNIAAVNNTNTGSHAISMSSGEPFRSARSALIATTASRLNHNSEHSSSTQSITPASSLPFKPLPIFLPRPGTSSTHRIHRSDSLEKLHARRRSTVSSIGSTSGVNIVNGVLTFNSAPNTARTNGTVTPSVVVGRPKSGSGSGMSRLAIGVLQEREMRERDKKREKGKEKEKPSTLRDDQPSQGLYSPVELPQSSQFQHDNELRKGQQLTIISSQSGIVSPSGSLFIESFHSPIDATLNSNLKGVTSETASSSVSYRHVDVPIATSRIIDDRRVHGYKAKNEEAASVSDGGVPDGDEDDTRILPQLLTRSHRNAAPQVGVGSQPFVNEESRGRSFAHKPDNGSTDDSGNDTLPSKKMRNAVQSVLFIAHDALPSALAVFRWHVTTISPTTATASPTRRLLHSVSQPSLRSFVQDIQSPPKSNLNQVYPPPPLPTLPPNHPQFVSEPHPYAMYGDRRYASGSGSGSHNFHLSTNADPMESSNPNSTDIPNINGSIHISHPYSHAYAESRQKDVRNNSSYLAIPFDSQLTSALMNASSASAHDSKSQVTSPPSGFKRTLRSSFKLPGSSRPNSSANATEGSNVGNLTVPGKTRTSTGGSLRSLRSSVSTPNLRNIFKFGHSNDNKPRDGEAAHDSNQSSNTKGKQPALPGSSSNAKQPPTPKKNKHPKTQYTAETWCDALLFPRPRFRAHVISPPASPIHVSALLTVNSQPQSSPGVDWVLPTATTSSSISPGLSPNTDGKHTTVIPPRTPPPRESHFTTDLYLNAIPPPPNLKPAPKGRLRKGPAPPLPSSSNIANSDRVEPEQPMLSGLEQALIAGEVRDREREKWSEVAKSSFQNRRSRSLSRSRKRAGTTSTMTSSAPSAPSERSRGRGRNFSDAGRKSEERIHGPTNSISRSLAAGLTSIAAEAFRQPTPTISTVSHHGRGTGGSHHGHGTSHYQTTTMATDSQHSHGYHSRTTSESGPASQRHGHSRNTSWGKAALKKLCGGTSEDEDDIRRPGDDNAVVSRGRIRANGNDEVTEENKLVNEGSRNQSRHEVNTGIEVNSILPDKTSTPHPAIATTQRSLSPDSSTSEHKDIVIALSTPPPQLSTPNGTLIEFPDLSGHPYAQSRTFPASAPYAGPYPLSRDYKPLYTPRNHSNHHRLHSNSTGNAVSETVEAKPMRPPPLHLEPVTRDDGSDSRSSHRRQADPTPYAYANVIEINKRESTLGVEEALLSSSSFRRFVDAILEDDKSDISGAIDVLAEAETPKHSPGNLNDDDEEQLSPYPVLRDVPILPNPLSNNVHYEAQMSRPFGAVDDLEQFRDLFFKPFHPPSGNEAVDSSDSSRFFPRSPSTNSPRHLGSSDFLFGDGHSKGSGSVVGSPSQVRQFSYERERRDFSNTDGDIVRSPSLMGLKDAALHLASTEPVVYTSGQDFPEDIESSRASSVIEHGFVEDTLRLGTVQPSVPVTTESGERRQSTTLSFIDNAPKRDTIMSTASAYSLPSVRGHNNNELRESFVTSASSSTSGVTKLLGNFPAPPPPLGTTGVGSASRPDSYHFLGLAEFNRIAASTSKT